MQPAVSGVADWTDPAEGSRKYEFQGEEDREGGKERANDAE